MSYPLLLSSSNGFLSMLDDPEPQLQHHALEQLDSMVDRFWPEIANQITKMYETIKQTTLINRHHTFFFFFAFTLVSFNDICHFDLFVVVVFQ